MYVRIENILFHYLNNNATQAKTLRLLRETGCPNVKDYIEGCTVWMKDSDAKRVHKYILSELF